MKSLKRILASLVFLSVYSNIAAANPCESLQNAVNRWVEIVVEAKQPSDIIESAHIFAHLLTNNPPAQECEPSHSKFRKQVCEILDNFTYKLLTLQDLSDDENLDKDAAFKEMSHLFHQRGCFSILP